MKHLNLTPLLFLFSTVFAASPLQSDSPVLNQYGRRSCGGFRVPTGRPECAADEVCIDDPWKPGCGMKCDDAGICVKKGPMCGGFAGFRCATSGKCVDDPTDSCDPMNGGADCAGVCAFPPTNPYPGSSGLPSTY